MVQHVLPGDGWRTAASGSATGTTSAWLTTRSGVELGVKFQTSKALQITGVRVYRVDTDAVTGSLWSAADGQLLANGDFTSGPGTCLAGPDVQPAGGDRSGTDLHRLVPHAELAYAFQYNYFTNSAFTEGPITALQSVEGDRNGVYCYDAETCAHFPTYSYQDLNYWVTPLWSYSFSGFFRPVDNAPTVNVAKAGSAIPVKFSLGGNFGLDVLKAGFPKATAVDCVAGSATDPVEQTLTAGGSSLSYDATAGQYVYVWKTDKAWAGKCFQFQLGLNDDTSHTFLVQFTK